MQLTIADIAKTFDGTRALDGVGFDVAPGEFVCLLGPSGCGKTSLLRIVAGLLQADRGSIRLGGKDLTHVPARERNFGIVFQAYSLFPHMTVAANVGYGMTIRGATRDAVARRTQALLATIGLAELADRYPWQLSGGQQQRVAIARALAVDPALLLLDEPLSALDARVRAELRAEIHRVQRRLGIPTIMVTHDQEEALALADTIVCMNQGRIEQAGPPRELYARPRTRFVAHFLGASNLLSTPWVRAHLPDLLAGRPPGVDATFDACVRPEDVEIVPSAHGNAVITDVTFLGALARLQIEWAGQRLLADIHASSSLGTGDTVGVLVRADRCAWVTA
jgi:iron(III) transport system ATP-binding protein